LDRYGFELEFFGGNSFILRALPPFINLEGLSPLDIADICREIIQLGRSTTIQDKQREIMQYLGCHMSIRAGDEIWDKVRIQRLIHELDQCDNPQFCAHGRPTYVKISFTELEKMFHRI
jgi:DNA mismatch repair protein MutL